MVAIAGRASTAAKHESYRVHLHVCIVDAACVLMYLEQCFCNCKLLGNKTAACILAGCSAIQRRPQHSRCKHCYCCFLWHSSLRAALAAIDSWCIAGGRLARLTCCCPKCIKREARWRCSDWLSRRCSALMTSSMPATRFR